MELKNRILSKANSMFEMCGISTITMDMIAKECGISKKTLYQVFSDKKTLVLESARTKFYERHAIFEKIYLESDNSMSAMLKILSIIREIMQSISPNYVLDMTKGYPELCKEYEVHSSIHDASMKDMFKKGIDEGVFVDTFNIDILGKLFFLPHRFIKTHLMVNLNPSESLAMHNTYFVVFLRGIATQKGRDILEEYLKENEIVLNNY